MTTPRDSEWLAWAGSVRREPRPMAVPETRLRDQRVSDWLLILAVFPGMFGLFIGVLCVLRLLGWEGL